MTEKEFLILYQKKRGLKNIHEAKEKINLFWEALFEALEVGGYLRKKLFLQEEL